MARVRAFAEPTAAPAPILEQVAPAVQPVATPPWPFKTAEDVVEPAVVEPPPAASTVVEPPPVPYPPVAEAPKRTRAPNKVKEVEEPVVTEVATTEADSSIVTLAADDLAQAVLAFRKMDGATIPQLKAELDKIELRVKIVRLALGTAT